ncbi:MAG: CheR family methyltransferase [Candidatus Deferrimicrobiaceae bacterium]
MTEFESFLVEVLPSLGLCPIAFNRRNIRRRVMNRMESQGIHDFRAYLSLLRRDPSEREELRPLLTVTISRFFRNRRVFETLSRQVFPPLAAKERPVRAWSAGCASGEEAYTLRILWDGLPGDNPVLTILATDVDDACLHRAGKGLYPESSLREVPKAIVEKYFRKEEGRFRLREDVIGSVEFQNHDLQRNPPPGAFDLVLCRNAAFTYFAIPRRIAVAEAIAKALSPDGFLVIGRTEKLPPQAAEWFTPAFPRDNILRRAFLIR